MAENDAQLVSICLAGERWAFDSLHAAHAGRVASYFLRSGFPPADADDLTQETFVRAFRSLRTFDARRGRFDSWIGTIARNVARRRWSRRAEPENFDPELAEETLAGAAEDAPEDREETAAVRDCVRSLPEELARLVRLRYVEARTTRGLAAATGLPESTVRLRLKEAQAMLAKCLKAKGIIR